MKKFTWVLCALFALCFAACDNVAADTSDNKIMTTESADDVLAGVSVTEALTSECPNGGVVINQGLDNNRNGKIDPEEVTSTQTVCNGVDGYTNKIVKNIFCTGDITGILATNSTNPLQTFTVPALPLTAVYTADVFASGDIFAYASVYDTAKETGASVMYSASQTGAATASVVFTYDCIGPANGGYWEMYLNRVSLVSTLVYHDTDIQGGSLTWTKSASDCIINNY